MSGNRAPPGCHWNGIVGAFLSLVVAYDPSWIDLLVNIFLNVGLPVGGLMICLFLGFVWKTQPALHEIEEGRAGTLAGPFARLCPPSSSSSARS